MWQELDIDADSRRILNRIGYIAGIGGPGGGGGA